MKRLVMLFSVGLMLLSVPYIAPHTSTATANAAVRVIEKDVTAVCFEGTTKVKEGKVRVHFNKEGEPDRSGNASVYRCSESAPDGRYYQYCFYEGSKTWYFNL